MTAESLLSAEAGKLDLQWNHGDPSVIRCTFYTDSTKTTVVDMTGFTYKAQARKRASHSDEWDFTVDATDAVNGIIDLTVPTDANLPGRGVWDLRQVSGSLPESTLLAGEFTALATVTEVP